MKIAIEKISIKEILNYIAVFTLFSDAFSYARLSFFEVKIYYFIIPIILILFFIYFKGSYLNVKFVGIVLVVFMASYVNILFGNNTFLLFGKQVIGISITSIFFYLLLKINDYDVPKIFKIYLNLAFIVAGIGLIQEISYLLDFKPGYDYSLVLGRWKYSPRYGSSFIRVNSILPEPTHFCNVMMPALFASMASLSSRRFNMQSNWKSAVIIIAFILTFSTTGYFVAIFSIILLFYNYGRLKHIMLVSLLAFLMSIWIYINVYEVRLRVRDTVGILTGKRSLENANLSTYALANNTIVAFKSLGYNPLFGSGLGSHAISYTKYMVKCDSETKKVYKLNYSDAGSLFLRLVSETGLLGLIVFMVFILKHHIVKKDDEGNVLWIINNAIMAYFAIRLIRNGHYFNEGFYLFVWMYYFSKIQVKLKPEQVLSEGIVCQRKPL